MVDGHGDDLPAGIGLHEGRVNEAMHAVEPDRSDVVAVHEHELGDVLIVGLAVALDSLGSEPGGDLAVVSQQDVDAAGQLIALDVDAVGALEANQDAAASGVDLDALKAVVQVDLDADQVDLGLAGDAAVDELREAVVPDRGDLTLGVHLGLVADRPADVAVIAAYDQPDGDAAVGPDGRVLAGAERLDVDDLRLGVAVVVVGRDAPKKNRAKKKEEQDEQGEQGGQAGGFGLHHSLQSCAARVPCSLAKNSSPAISFFLGT